ncbi:MAG: Imm53 family immunity protein [Thermoguttaceae bacterium]
MITDTKISHTRFQGQKHTWIECKFENRKFIGYCGPLNLDEMINVFQKILVKIKLFLRSSANKNVYSLHEIKYETRVKNANYCVCFNDYCRVICPSHHRREWCLRMFAA